MTYSKTVILSNHATSQELKGLLIGQWVQYGQNGAKGQFMGVTRSGEGIIRWGKFSKANAQRNHLMRKLALNKGAKRKQSKRWVTITLEAKPF